MKIYTSYFYQIRFFTPNMIPFSTAVWDPRWYYKNHQGDWYIDGRGVINGLRAEPFAPGPQLQGLCRGACIPGHPADCSFLEGYWNQLNQLNFDNIMTRTETLCNKVAQYCNQTNPIAVFIVHEAASNPCSERGQIQKWFKKNGIECEEWRRE